MDLKRRKELIDKYWEGRTSLAEEHELKTAFSTSTPDDINEEDGLYFSTLSKFGQLETDTFFDDEILSKIRALDQPKPWQMRLRRYWQIAAAVALLLSVSIFLAKRSAPSMDDLAAVEDPREAFEITKQALLLISTELNKGATYTYALDEFNETLNKIKIEE